MYFRSLLEMEESLEFLVHGSSNSKPVGISAVIPSMSFIPSQQIPITVTVFKEEFQKVASIGIKLIRLDQTNPTHRKVLTVVKTKGLISPGRNVTYEMDLPIPRMQMQSKCEGKERSEQTRRHDHEVRISVKMGGSRRNCRLSIPVQIDSVAQKKGKVWDGDGGFLMPIFAFK